MTLFCKAIKTLLCSRILAVWFTLLMTSVTGHHYCFSQVFMPNSTPIKYIDTWIDRAHVDFQQNISANLLSTHNLNKKRTHKRSNDSFYYWSLPISKLMTVDSAINNNAYCEIFISVKPIPKSLFFLVKNKRENLNPCDAVTFSSLIIGNSTIDEDLFLHKLFLKCAFVFETSAAHVQLNVSNKKLGFSSLIRWEDRMPFFLSEVPCDQQNSLTTDQTTSQHSTKINHYDLPGNASVDSSVMYHIKSYYTLPAKYYPPNSKLYDSIIREFLLRKFRSLPSKKIFLIDDNTISLKIVNSLVSRNPMIWEKIQISLTASIIEDQVRIDCNFDGQYVNSKNEPKEDAFKKSSILEDDFPDEVKSFIYNLNNELRKTLIK